MQDQKKGESVGGEGVSPGDGYICKEGGFLHQSNTDTDYSSGGSKVLCCKDMHVQYKPPRSRSLKGLRSNVKRMGELLRGLGSPVRRKEASPSPRSDREWGVDTVAQLCSLIEMLGDKRPGPAEDKWRGSISASDQTRSISEPRERRVTPR